MTEPDTTTMTETSPWKDWQYGPVPLGDVLDRMLTVLGTVAPEVRTKILAAMKDAQFEIIMRVPQKHKPVKEQAGATIALTISTKDAIPTALMPILMVIGFPDVPPSSITPLAWDRMRAFWEFGKGAGHGELAVKEVA